MHLLICSQNPSLANFLHKQRQLGLYRAFWIQCTAATAAADEEEEEVWDPDCIRAIIPFTNDEGKVQFLYASQGKFNGFIYIGQMGENRPLKSIEIPADILVTYMNMTETKDGNIITLGFENGEV